MPIEDANDKPGAYVTVTYGIRGYFAVLVELVSDEPWGEFYEPVNTGLGSYPTQAEAIPEALEWAASEEVPFQLSGYNERGELVS